MGVTFGSCRRPARSRTQIRSATPNSKLKFHALAGRAARPGTRRSAGASGSMALENTRGCRRHPAIAHAPMKTPRKTTRLRQLIRNGCVGYAWRAQRAATARLIAQVGFDAVLREWRRSGRNAITVGGVPDIDLLSLAEVAQFAGYIARVVKIPCACVIADTGFGGPGECRQRRCASFERAGLAGMHL